MAHRTYEIIKRENIEQFISLSFSELERLYETVAEGKYEVFRNKLIAICLCQGVAQHIVESGFKGEYNDIIHVEKDEIEEKGFVTTSSGKVLSGIRDIDIWFFFEESEKVKMPHIRNMLKSIDMDLLGLGNRKIDFLKKAVGKRIDGFTIELPKESVIKYITTKGTSTANHLKRKSVVGLYPKAIEGEVLWSVKRIKA